MCWSFQKGCGYHLDLFMVGVMLGVCSLMGLPWFVAATVLSITHVNSLKLESECSAPGEQPKFLGIREQRITGLMIFTLMGSSVFMTSVLKVSHFSFHYLSNCMCSYFQTVICSFAYKLYLIVIANILAVTDVTFFLFFSSFLCLCYTEYFFTWGHLLSEAFR